MDANQLWIITLILMAKFFQLNFRQQQAYAPKGKKKSLKHSSSVLSKILKWNAVKCILSISAEHYTKEGSLYNMTYS